MDLWPELATLVTIMLLGHWLEMRALGRAQGALAALAALLPDEAERVTDLGVESVPLASLAAGDVVLVRPGGRVPADGEILEGDADSTAPDPPPVNGWARALAVGGAMLIASWVLLVVLASRRPPGVLKELVGFLPNCVKTARALRSDPAVPRRAKLAVGFAALWCLSPIDLIPEFLPVIGPLDDVVVIAIAVRYAARQVPREVLETAWTGEASTLDRLLGPRRPNAA